MPEGTTVMDFLWVWGLRIGSALLVFFVGRLVARWIVRFARHYMEGRKLDPLVVNFVGSILEWSLLLLVLIFSLNMLGADTTAIVALLAAAGIAIGLALQDSMKNFASGALLTVFRPFTTGHFVEAAGTSGNVEAITLFTSTLLTPDNREVIIPNSAIYNGTITNYSARPTRRVDMEFGVSYSDDLRKVRELLQQIVADEPRVLVEPAPIIAVGELRESSVTFYVRPWVTNIDYWDVKWAITEKVKVAFDDAGFTIPFPQVEVHVQAGAAQASNEGELPNATAG